MQEAIIELLNDLFGAFLADPLGHDIEEVMIRTICLTALRSSEDSGAHLLKCSSTQSHCSQAVIHVAAVNSTCIAFDGSGAIK